MKKRLSWIDIARGIGIIAVLYGHAVSGDSIRHILYAFHMPLFFFLSGVVFRPQKYKRFFPFFWKNIVTLLIPYCIFAVLSYLVWLSGRSDLPSSIDIGGHLLNIIYGNSSALFFNVVLWFLPCLFMTKVLFWGIYKVFPNSKPLAIVLIIISIFGYIFSLLFPGIKLPLGTETAITAVVFFGVGYLWYTHEQSISQKISLSNPILIFILLMIMISLAQINFQMYGYQIDMRLNRYSNFFLFYIAALSGIFAVVLFSLKINSQRILEYIGKNSLILFVWHIIIFTYLSQFAHMFIDTTTFNSLRNYYIAPLFTILATFLILAGLKIYQKIKKIIVSK